MQCIWLIEYTKLNETHGSLIIFLHRVYLFSIFSPSHAFLFFISPELVQPFCELIEEEEEEKEEQMRETPIILSEKEINEKEKKEKEKEK